MKYTLVNRKRVSQRALQALAVGPVLLVACVLDNRPLLTLRDEDRSLRGAAGEEGHADSGAAGADDAGGGGEGGGAASGKGGAGGTHAGGSHAGRSPQGAAGLGAAGVAAGYGGLAGLAGLAGNGGGQGGNFGGGAGTAAGGFAQGGSGAGGVAGSSGASGAGAGTAGAAGSNPACPDVDQDGKPDCQQTLVSNAAFDSTVSGWSVETTAEQAWGAGDAHDVTSSGSISVKSSLYYESDSFAMTGSFQCLPVVAAHRYQAAAELFIAFGQPSVGNGALGLLFYDGDNCTGATMGSTVAQSGMVDVWQPVEVAYEAPAGSKSVLLRLLAVKPMFESSFEVRFDNVLLREQAP